MELGKSKQNTSSESFLIFRLVHLVHLNCENEESQKHSGILREQAEAIQRMRAAYPGLWYDRIHSFEIPSSLYA